MDIFVNTYGRANNAFATPPSLSINGGNGAVYDTNASSVKAPAGGGKAGQSNIGFYYYYGKDIIAGKQYLLSFKIRGQDAVLKTFGEESNPCQKSIFLNSDWQQVTIQITAKSDFVIYSTITADGGYIEIDPKSLVAIEVGGVAIPNLATVTNATIAVNPSYPAWSTKIVTNYLQPGHYFVAYQTDQPEDYQTRVRISNNGQNDASTSWGGVTQSGSHVYYEFNVPDDGKPYNVMIYSTPYNVNATKDIGISNVYVGKLSDQVGGVTKPLDIGSPTVWKGISLVDTIQLAKYSASGAHDQQEVLTYHLGQKLEPSTKYRISFVARGAGNLNTYLFPGVAPSQDGQRSDGRIITSLTGDFRDYSYEVTTYANFSGDTDKQLLFRLPADSKAGWVDIYIGSIRVEKVGGVAKAPSQPQAAGLLYSGSFTVSTGSTPVWAYKAIQVGDMDGDTLTVTLTPHQTAGAKLDQVYVALYDSTRTTALATYAYPATEQTSTITIVDKRPGKGAQLLFYANDKDINTNTTIEFGDVEIVGL